ncbi:glycosyltransferase family 8 protein [Moniliophthora roreri]|nr:glycosyltransferase family 8 protein [Moniliophthora roreri]
MSPSSTSPHTTLLHLVYRLSVPLIVQSRVVPDSGTSEGGAPIF